MSTYKSEFLQVLAARGFIHQVPEPEALDALAREKPITAYIGFDCTAPSLHVGSLLPIMMLYWLQQTGHKPIPLMGGGTTRAGDPAAKGENRRGAGQQCPLGQRAQLYRFPARHRPPLLDQPHACLRFRETAARTPAG